MSAFADVQPEEDLLLEVVAAAPASGLELVRATTPVVLAEESNLYAVCERVAARAATPATRRHYASIYRRFCDALRGELGRVPVVGDLDADAIAWFARVLEREGGRGGGPSSPATRRQYVTMLRALAGQLGQADVVAEIRVPGHRPGPPETISETEYSNLVRVPDRRSALGRRDHAILRLLGDCGVRNDELRRLVGSSVRRARANARHQQLYVHGKGGVERVVPIAELTQAALDAWLAVHPLARGTAGLRDADPLFIRLRAGGSQTARTEQALSNQAVHKLVARHALAAGITPRLAHPHSLRAYYATTLASENVPVHVIQRRLGHADLQTTSRYMAERADDVDGVADALDRRHEAEGRRRG